MPEVSSQTSPRLALILWNGPMFSMSMARAALVPGKKWFASNGWEGAHPTMMYVPKRLQFVGEQHQHPSGGGYSSVAYGTQMGDLTQHASTAYHIVLTV